MSVDNGPKLSGCGHHVERLIDFRQKRVAWRESEHDGWVKVFRIAGSRIGQNDRQVVGMQDEHLMERQAVTEYRIHRSAEKAEIDLLLISASLIWASK